MVGYSSAGWPGRQYVAHLVHCTKSKFCGRHSSNARKAATRIETGHSSSQAPEANASKDLRCSPAAGRATLSVPSKGAEHDAYPEEPCGLITVLLQVYQNLSAFCSAEKRSIESLTPDEVDDVWLAALAQVVGVQGTGDVLADGTAEDPQHHGAAAPLAPSTTCSGSRRRKNAGDGRKRPRRDRAQKRGGGGGDDGRLNVPEPDNSEPFWACPFFKYDPVRYDECLGSALRHPTDVRQHIGRCHLLRERSQCPTCGLVFENDANEHRRNAHILQQTCPLKNFAVDGVTERQWKDIKEDATRKHRRTLEERWYYMWDAIFFPRVPRPGSTMRQGAIDILQAVRLQVRNQSPRNVTEILMANPVVEGLAYDQVYNIANVVLQTLVESQPAQEIPAGGPSQVAHLPQIWGPQGLSPENSAGAAIGYHTAVASVAAPPDLPIDMNNLRAASQLPPAVDSPLDPLSYPEMHRDEYGEEWNLYYTEPTSHISEPLAYENQFSSVLEPTYSWPNEIVTDSGGCDAVGGNAMSSNPLRNSFGVDELFSATPVARNLDSDLP